MTDGFLTAAQYMASHPITLLFIVFGMVWGIVFGAMPGLTGVVGVALLIPFTFGFGPIEGLLLLGSVYVGSTFGGSISAILFNTPGSPEAACTGLDGYPMAKKGQAGKALGIALAASAVGGIFGTVVLMLAAPPLAKVALSFGPAEYFALAVLGITAIASIGTSSVTKALIAGILGLVIATVGIDPLTGGSRFTFGNDLLLSGIGFIPAIIGMFALSEVLVRFSERVPVGEAITKVSTALPKFREMMAMKGTLARSSVLGTIIGTLPGVGATTAAFMSYSEAVRWSRHPEKFGTGEPEGIAAPEAANNAAVGGSMVPLLALGIPGSAATAVMIGGLTIHGIVPGPMLLVQNKELVYSVFIGMFIANLLMIFFGLKASRHFAKILDAPYALIGPSIVVLCMTGVYALRNNVMDVVVMLVFGAFGFLLRKLDYPIAPLIIGLVLGPVAEISLRRALMLSSFDWSSVLMRPIAGTLLALSALSLIYGFYGQFRRQWRRRRAALGAA
ncbi:MAG: tripartite tricarboxylate transporter permease [Azoarcus sp.]|nr:tripartite tricarboxylate transporter permease [Azoarcus sp.]